MVKLNGISSEDIIARCSRNKSKEWGVMEVDGRLRVVKMRPDQEDQTRKVTERTLREFLILASDNKDEEPSLEKVLRHPLALAERKEFVEYALGLDESGKRRLYSFSHRAALDVLESGNLDDSLILECMQELLKRGCGTYYLQPLVDLFHKVTGHKQLFIQVSHSYELDRGAFEALSPQAKKVLYEAAYAFNNPSLYEPAEVVPRPDQYSIHLMWTGQASPDQMKEVICAWRQAHPGVSIHLWSQDKTDLGLQINARTWGDLDVVRDNPDVFAGEMLSFPSRMDVTKAAIIDTVLRCQETEYCILADPDIAPLAAEALFDSRTMGMLDAFGMVMGKTGAPDILFENSFQIVKGSHEQRLREHREMVIDAGIQMAHDGSFEENRFYSQYLKMMTSNDQGVLPLKLVSVI